jgi:hypothetical protein
MREKYPLVKCPKCQGCKTIYGRNASGNPATLPCDRCINSTGEVDYGGLTEEEKNPKPKIHYKRDDI